jgi:hypothetical protein
LPENPGLHALATDLLSLRILNGGVLYPCQAIFLGRTLPIVGPCDSTSELARRIGELGDSTPYLIVEGSGLLINPEITAAEHAVLHGLAEVVRRIEPAAPIRYLTDHELNGILNEDGHHYRISADNNLRHSAVP